VPCPRNLPGWTVAAVKDKNGDPWAAPLVLGDTGARLFPVSFGPKWEPCFTPEQSTLLNIAAAVQADLGRYLRGEAPELLPTLLEWAATALVAANHIPMDAIQGLSLMDDHLMVGVLTVMAPDAG